MENVTEARCERILAQVASPPALYSSQTRYVLAALLFVFPLLTLLGNITVILAILRTRLLQTFANAFVVSLAVADILVALFVMPFAIYQRVTNFEWRLGKTTCLMAISFDILFTTVSILNLVCITGIRYLAICRPFDYERTTWRKVGATITGCWVLPLFISFLPIFNQWNIISIRDIYYCVSPADAPVCFFITSKTFAWSAGMVAFYIPALCLIVCNFRIFLAARKQAVQIRSVEPKRTDQRYSSRKQELKAAKTLGIITGCFCVFWLPFFVTLLVDTHNGYSVPAVTWATVTWLGYVNSTMNPFIYCLNSSFRAAAFAVLRCRAAREQIVSQQ